MMPRPMKAHLAIVSPPLLETGGKLVGFGMPGNRMPRTATRSERVAEAGLSQPSETKTGIA